MKSKKKQTEELQQKTRELHTRLAWCDQIKFSKPIGKSIENKAKVEKRKTTKRKVLCCGEKRGKTGIQTITTNKILRRFVADVVA
jgi:hypothetical protein